MAWLNQTPENIASGWGPPPQFHAPEIGSLVAGILHNRLAQQQQQINLSQSLSKQIQAQQEDKAFGEQASNAGLLPGVDTSNMSAPQIAALAKLIQQQGSEAVLNEYRRALGGAATTRAGAYAANQADTGDTIDQGPQTVTDEYGREWRQGTGGRWFLIPRPQSKSGLDEKAWAAPQLEPQIVTPDQSDQGTPNDQANVTTTTSPPSGRVPPRASAGDATINMPRKGDIVGRYAYIGEEGSDPNDPKNWTPAGQP